MALFITKCFFRDDLSGSFYLEIDKYNCSILVFKRKDAEQVREFTEHFCKPAVYVLMNKDDRKAYIGQTDNFYTRIQNHLAKKDFWDTAIAFTAKDNSLSSTEVRYLEAEAYEAAQSAGRYDLSENGQAPQKPHVTYQQKLQTEEFFNTIKLFSQDTGCDIFVNSNNRISKSPKNATTADASIKTHKRKADLPIMPDDSLKGRGVQLTLNGQGPYRKNKFAYAVVKEYLQKYPSSTFEELRRVFPKKLLGSWARWELLEDRIKYASQWKERGEVKARYCFDEESILHSCDGIPFVVCTEWDFSNLPNLLAIVIKENWTYSVIK